MEKNSQVAKLVVSTCMHGTNMKRFLLKEISLRNCNFARAEFAIASTLYYVRARTCFLSLSLSVSPPPGAISLKSALGAVIYIPLRFLSHSPPPVLPTRRRRRMCQIFQENMPDMI